MSEYHNVYLNLGSNIQPEINLFRAIQSLFDYGEIRGVSNAWESQSVGAPAPNYLNACVLFLTSRSKIDVKEKIIHPIETRLGRERNEDKYMPRTIDIDIILFDDQLLKDNAWNDAFVIVPLAEIYPEYQNQLTKESATETATRLRKKVWIEARPEVLSQLNGGISGAKSEMSFPYPL